MSILYTQKHAIKSGDLSISGGWRLKIPEIRIVEEDEAAYIKYWVREGYSYQRAHEKVVRDHQRIYNTRYLMLIRVWLGRKAEKYAEMHPHLGLKGFRPDILARYFVPGRPRGGYLPEDPAVIQALQKMGVEYERVREAEEDQG